MEQDKEDQETQETPQGHTIPVPKREDVFRDLEKVAKPRRDESDDDASEDED